MKIFFQLTIILLISLNLYANEMQMCYSVQLSSNAKTPQGKQNLSLHTFADNCKILEIDEYYKVQCGCYEKREDALSELSKFQQNFSNAYVTQTNTEIYKNDANRVIIDKNVTLPKQCHSIELLKVENTLKQSEALSHYVFPEECKIFTLGKNLSVRCGCYENEEDFNTSLALMQKKYHDAHGALSYASRFQEEPKTLDANETINVVVPEAPKVLLYKSCQKIYNDKNYTQVVECCKSAKSEYENIELQLLWAKSEEKRQRINYEIAAYERINALKPNDYEMLRKLMSLYKKNHQDTTAQALVSDINDANLSQKQRDSLQKILVLQSESLEKFSATIATKLGYDTNIASSSSNESIDAFALEFGLTPQQRADLNGAVGSFFSKSVAMLSYKHDLTEKGGWFVKADLNALAQIMFSDSLFNNFYFKGSMALGYKFNASTLTLPIFYTRTHFLKEDLLQGYGFTPTLSTSLNKNYLLNIGTELSYNKYIPKTLNLYDSKIYGVSSSLYYLSGINYIGLSAVAQKISAKNAPVAIYPPRYLDAKKYSLGLLGLYNFDNGYALKANYTMMLTHFSEKLYAKDSVTGYYFQPSLREDILNTITLSASKELLKGLKVLVDYRYANSKSNALLSDYEKHIYTLGLQYNY